MVDFTNVTKTESDGTEYTITPTGDPNFNIEGLFKDAGGMGNSWFEKRSEASPEYPYNNVTQTESGHTFEMDDTPGKERIRLQHRVETFIEMHPDGSEVHKIQGDSFEIVIKDKNVRIQGSCNVTVLGDATFDIQGDKYEYVKGDCYQVVDGDFFQTVKGKSTFLSQGDMKIAADTGFNGRLFLMGGGITVDSDFFVNGELSANKITSETRVDALLGVSAGPMGFVSSTGGITVGVPGIAIPGVVTASALVTAPLFVSEVHFSGSVFGGLVADTVNDGFYNIHIHKSYKGPTGPPMPKRITA